MLVNSVTHPSSAGYGNSTGPILQAGINTAVSVTKHNPRLSPGCLFPAQTTRPLGEVKKRRVGCVLPSLSCLKTASLDKANHVGFFSLDESSRFALPILGQDESPSESVCLLDA